MRIWHESLIPKLCGKHLVAMWHEGLYCLSITVNQYKTPYQNHPAVKEFKEAPLALIQRMGKVYQESLKRGYHFDLMKLEAFANHPYIQSNLHLFTDNKPQQWQSLKIQKEAIKLKGCECKI